MKSTTDYLGDMATATLKGDLGSSDIITGTTGHRILSVDREDYVPLGDLTIGERVRSADGWATVASLARTWTDGQA